MKHRYIKQKICLHAGAITHSSASFGAGNGPVLFDNVHCIGTELMLSGCANRGFGVHDCSPYEDAGVECTCELMLDIDHASNI